MGAATDHPERIIPDEVPPGILAVHLARYAFASSYCTDRVVLDIACGVGYGARRLAGSARRVTAADIDVEAVEHGRHRYEAANLAYLVTDCQAVALAAESFDVVCSFETIEHVPDVGRYLDEIVRLLKPGGCLLASTPHAKRSTSTPENPFHRQEWSVPDFERLLRQFFDEVQLFGQCRLESRTASLLKRLDVLKLRARVFPLWMTRAAARAAGGQTMADVRLDEVAFLPGRFVGATEIVAVASHPHRRAAMA